MTEEYTVVQLKRQEELTRRIQDKLAKAKRRLSSRRVIELKKPSTNNYCFLTVIWSPRWSPNHPKNGAGVQVEPKSFFIKLQKTQECWL